MTLNLLKQGGLPTSWAKILCFKPQEIPRTQNPKSHPDVSPLFRCHNLYFKQRFLFCLPNNDKTKSYKQILAPDVLLPSLVASLANAVSSDLCFRVAGQHQQVEDTLMGSPLLRSDKFPGQSCPILTTITSTGLNYCPPQCLVRGKTCAC